MSEIYLIVKPSDSDLLHFGKGHDDNPPGRGSGRYAWGSGEKRSYMQRKIDTKVSSIKANENLTTKQKLRKTSTAYALGRTGQIYINLALDAVPVGAYVGGALLGSTPLAAAGLAGLAAIGIKSISDTLKMNAELAYDTNEIIEKARSK